MNVTTTYKAMSDADKAALKVLQAEEIARTGREIKLGDMVAALTPGFPDPEYLSIPPLVKNALDAVAA